MSRWPAGDRAVCRTSPRHQWNRPTRRRLW